MKTNYILMELDGKRIEVGIKKEGEWVVCCNKDVVSQGKSTNSAIRNFAEAWRLFNEELKIQKSKKQIHGMPDMQEKEEKARAKGM